MHVRPPRRPAAAILVAAATALAACGGDDAAAPASAADQEAATGPTTTDDTATTTTTAVAVPVTTVEATVTSAAADDVDCGSVTFPSGGRELPGERCEPLSGEAPWPAAVILGGCVDSDDRTLERALASSLATAGVVALIVDYHAAAPPPDPDTYCQPSPETFAAVPAMVSAVTDATAWLRTDPDVDGAAIGAVGYSLGGLWAAYAHLGDVDLASVPPSSFSAIAMLAGPALPDALAAAEAGRMPPLHLVHGDIDDVVPVDDSTKLTAAAQAGGTEATLVVVPAMDHGWADPGNSAERTAAVADITDFLTSRLRP